ncbi:hypothetical protein JHK85_043882 [Glycine max]|nr:hypothetical protein JHK85_043882 [Glycine max]
MEDNALVLLFYAMEDKWKLLMSPLLLMLLLISPLASFHLVVNVRVTDDASILKQSKFKVLPPEASNYLSGSKKYMIVDRGRGRLYEWMITINNGLYHVLLSPGSNI